MPPRHPPYFSPMTNKLPPKKVYDEIQLGIIAHATIYTLFIRGKEWKKFGKRKTNLYLCNN